MGLKGFIILLIVIVAGGFIFFPEQSDDIWQDIIGSSKDDDLQINNTKPPIFNNKSSLKPDDYETLTIANWNIQTFGPSKASDPTLLRFYAELLSQYDIVYVQEIRDISGIAFDYLCAYMPEEYECLISSRAGRTQVKEQYGLMYKEDIKLTEFKDYNPDKDDRWERPPLMTEFQVGEYSFTVYNIHVKPDDVKQELAYLELEANKAEGNVIIIGDLNADCGYYSQRFEPEFGTGWQWVVPNTARTNMGQTPCAYDRAILNDDMFYEFVNYGVYTNNITEEHSDHYLIWVEINVTK